MASSTFTGKRFFRNTMNEWPAAIAFAFRIASSVISLSVPHRPGTRTAGTTTVSFGDRYREYIKRARRTIPFLY
jgi:hypothetical protein